MKPIFVCLFVFALAVLSACDRSATQQSNNTPTTTPSRKIAGKYLSTNVGINSSVLEVTSEGGNLYITGQWSLGGPGLQFHALGTIQRQPIKFVDSDYEKASLTGNFFWESNFWGGRREEKTVNVVIEKDSIRFFSPNAPSASVVFTKTW